MAQPIPFVNHLQHYYQLGQYAPAPQNNPNYVAPNYIPAPVIVGGGGGGGTGRHVQILAANPDTLRELHRQDQEDREDSRGTIAAVLGGLGTIALAGLTAFVGKNWIDSVNELKQAETFRDEQLPELDQLIQARLRPILNKHVENLEAKSFWSKTFVVLTVGLLASAATAFAGGMLAISWLITAAIVAGVLIAAAGTFAGVWYLMTDLSLTPEMAQELEALELNG